MVDKSKFLIHARRLHNSLRHGIENMDVAADKLAIERPLFEHFSCGMYLISCLAYIEGKYGEKPWRSKSGQGNSFDQFLQSLPLPNVFSSIGINQKGLEALICIRNAVTHNASDLGKNTDKNSLERVSTAKLCGVVINSSTVTLSSTNDADFMEYVRLSLIAISKFHGDA